MSPEMNTIQVPKHLAHIRRPSLPWVDPDLELTECGRVSGEMKSVVSYDEAKALAERLGKNRKLLALHLCETCVGTCGRNDRSFAAIFERRYAGMRWRDPAKDQRLHAELEAIEKVLVEHADLIRGFADGRPLVADLAARRVRKATS